VTRAELSKLGYAEALRSLDLQEKAVEQLRSRAGTVIAAVTFTTSFLGTQAIQRSNEVGMSGSLALTATATSIGLCLFVLQPRSDMTFSLNGSRMYEEMLRFADDRDELHRRLIYWLERLWRQNQKVFVALNRAYVGATIALAAQLVLWSWTVADILSR
jgi:hypothetical protein